MISHTIRLALATLTLASGLAATTARADYDYQNANRIARLTYEAILQREADEGGLENATSMIESSGFAGLESWMPWLAGTPEFRTQIANRGADEIAQNLYGVFLRRAPNGNEVYNLANELYYTGAVSQTVLNLLLSPEFAQDVLDSREDFGGSRPGR